MGEEAKPKLACVGCGRELRQEDEGRLWDRCHFCNRPVCFGCTRYRGIYRQGLYLTGYYIEVLRTCPECYGEKRGR